MLTLRISVNLLKIILSWLTLLSIPAQGSDFIGHAYQTDSKKLAYSEEHTIKNGVFHQVVYKEANGQVFAKKNIDYSNSFIAPDILQDNSRNGELIKTELRENKYRVSYRENFDQTIQRSDIRSSENFVIDAGFDHYIRLNWDVLISDKETVIQYLIPSHLKSIDLRITQAACKDEADDSRICFIVAADNWLYRMLSSSLFLSYDKQHKRLMTFSGRSNISDKNGNYQDITIHYKRTRSLTDKESVYAAN